MHIDPILPALSAIVLITLIISIILKRFNQPYIIAYLLAGVVLGPYGFALISNDEAITKLGAVGVVILMFFIGMEVSPRRLAANWRITVLGTFLQIGLSVGVVWVLGYFMHWPINRIILIGFVISLSSTVVVLQLLRDWKELDTRIGQDTVGILLVQDIAVVPMIILLGFIDEQKFDSVDFALQIIGAVIIVASVVWVTKHKKLQWKWVDAIAHDKEMQVFASLGICTGFALITGLMNLSTALGAFVAGIFVSRIRQTSWVSDSLDSLRVLFVALFFLSIGIMINPMFIIEHAGEIASLVLAVLVTNTVISALTLNIFGYDWRSSVYAGTLLSQVGEFSFILAAIGLNSKIIGDYGYQLTISIIAVTLLISPIMIFIVRRFIHKPVRAEVKTR